VFDFPYMPRGLPRLLMESSIYADDDTQWRRYYYVCRYLIRKSINFFIDNADTPNYNGFHFTISRKDNDSINIRVIDLVKGTIIGEITRPIDNENINYYYKIGIRDILFNTMTSNTDLVQLRLIIRAFNNDETIRNNGHFDTVRQYLRQGYVKKNERGVIAIGNNICDTCFNISNTKCSRCGTVACSKACHTQCINLKK